jgi:hypothetical protein
MFFRNENPQNNYNNNNRDTYSLNDYRNVNIEISYDNFDTINLDNIRKQQYGQDLRSQIESDRLRKEAEKRRKKQEDLEEELRLQREREELERRQNEENKRYRPKINLPIRSIKVEEKEKERENLRYKRDGNDIMKKNVLSDSALNLLREREMQIDNFNNKIMKNLEQIKKEYNYNMKTLKGQVGLLNDMHERNKKYNDNKFYKEVNSIKDNVDYKVKKDEIDAKYLYDLVAKTNYARQMLRFKIGNVPKRNFVIKSYTSDYKIDIDEEPNIPSYVNFSRDVSYKGPRWRQNESTWWNY